MRITGKDKACGTVFSRVDKVDFLITKTCSEVGEEEEESMAYIAIATYTLITNSLTPACVYAIPISLPISLCACTRYPPWNIFAASQRFVLWASPRRFLVLFFWRFIVLARQSFFNGGLAFCFKSRSSKALLVRYGMITPGELAWHGMALRGMVRDPPVPSAGSCARAKPGLAGVLAACMFMSRAATGWMDGWMVMVGVR
jgi:hypothetical protein